MKRALVTLLAALWAALPAMGQEVVPLVLTKEQAQTYAKMPSYDMPRAMAVSPDGAWGFAYGVDDDATAARMALGFCRQHLKRGRADCVLLSQNGKRVAPDQIAVRRVSDVYTPINGRKAASIIGRSGFDFAGAEAAARARLAAGQTEAAPQDKGLRGQLVGRTILTTGRSGFGVWLGPRQAEHMASTNNGVLTIRFNRWTVAADGLICMYDGWWLSTGKPVGTRCLILGQMAAGLGHIYWDGTPKKKRPAQLIAGDARVGAVK